jgi:ABC-type Fe3+/spermidine/putrescine transport system ATPase subunit
MCSAFQTKLSLKGLTPMEAIEAEALTLRFGTNDLLRNSTFNIHSGEMVAVLGPSGSGKTTLLRAIAGFTQPFRGRIRLSGLDVQLTRPEARSVSMLFQEPALFPQLDAAENALAAKRAQGANRQEIARTEALTGSLIDLFEMKETLGRPFRNLSGGEKQRAAIIRCLVNAEGRDILLLDEPFKSTLNHALRWTVMRALKQWHETNAPKTIVFVTHEFVEAAYLCDRIAVISEDKNLLFGSPNDLYSSAPSLSVAATLGPLNVILLTDSSRLVLGDLIKPRLLPSNAASLACRPGSVIIDANNSTRFTVMQSSFLGDYKRVRLQQVNDASIRIEADIPITHSCHVGETVGIALSSDAVSFYDENGLRVRV